MTGSARGLGGSLDGALDLELQQFEQPVLAESERRLQAARRLTGLALWNLDARTGRLTWSDEMFGLVGRRPGSVDPDYALWLGHVHPDDRDGCLRLHQHGEPMAESGGGFENILRIRRLDGDLRWLQTWSSVEREDGEVVREWGVSLDVTDRERSAAIRAESEHRLAAAYELTGLAWWEWTFGAATLAWSDGMRALVGLTPADPPLSIEEWLSMVDAEDRETSAVLEREATERGTPYLHVFRVHLRDGRTRFLQSWTEPMRQPDGEIVGLRGATLDVTDRTLNEQAVAAAYETFRAAFDHAPNGMAMISLRGPDLGQVVRINEALAAMLGVELDELLASSLADWTFPEDQAVSRERFQVLLSGQAPEGYERRFRRKDGSAVFVWMTLSIARGPDDRPQFVICHLIDETERRRQQQVLERLALTDELTGLANRTVVNLELTRSLVRTDGTRREVGLLLLDVDRFKLVNDTLGHPIGDSLLIEVANRLRSVVSQVVRPGDATVGRLGGDEFIVLVEDPNRVEDMQAVATSILDALHLPFELPSGDTVVVTSSVGIAMTHSRTRSPQELLRQADLALYDAKDHGRDRCSVYDDDLHAETLEQVRTESVIRVALRDGMLRVVLQPVVDLATGRVASAEALVRIEVPGQGLILPGAFIDVAEETGLITEIDCWMMREVVRLISLDDLAAPWERRLPPRIAVNVSGRTIEQAWFVPRLAGALSFYGVRGERLLVELTESTLLDDNAVVLRALVELDRLGVDAGIDDFGTGYSALAYLQRFPLSFLKIDLSFVRLLGSNKRANAVVAAIIDLAHAHDLKVIAEGVETPEQADMLLAMGCDRGQGWLFGKPVPPSSVRPGPADDHPDQSP